MQRVAIKREMERQKRSLAWLADQVKVTKATKQHVSNWLNEEKPTNPRDSAVFGDMATALGMDLTDLSIPVSFKVPRIRMAGEVPAGEWGDPLASEEFIDVHDIRFEHPRRFAARVVGTSCFPYLQPGDLTIWHVDPDPNYQVFVLAQRKGDHGCTVKELIRDEVRQRPVLHSPNPHHADPEDGDGWGVIARLVGVEFDFDGTMISAYEDKGITKRKLAFRQKTIDVS